MSIVVYLFELIFILFIVYLLVRFILDEHYVCQLKYIVYVSLVMFFAIILPPVFLIRARNALNIRLAAVLLNLCFRYFGLTYRVENGEVLQNKKAYVIVANHQSSIDFIGMMNIWPDYVRYCTILAKKELIWAGPFGPSSWLAGVEFVDRKNRQRAKEKMELLTKKIQEKSLRLWIFPEGTRHMGETFLPFKLGAFRLAIEAQVPIVPVVFSSYKSLYNVEKSTKNYYWRSGCVTVKCLEPIETTGMTLENDLQRLIDMTRKCMLDAYLTIETKVYNQEKNK